MKRYLIVAVAILAGCAGDPPPPPTVQVSTDTFCRIMKNLKTNWSTHDTTDSIENLRTISRVKTCTCAKHKPAACKSKQLS